MSVSQPLLLPVAFHVRDAVTQLVHQGAVLGWPDGRVLGYTILCTDELSAQWEQPPSTIITLAVVSCLQCLGAREVEVDE